MKLQFCQRRKKLQIKVTNYMFGVTFDEAKSHRHIILCRSYVILKS